MLVYITFLIVDCLYTVVWIHVFPLCCLQAIVLFQWPFMFYLHFGFVHRFMVLVGCYLVGLIQLVYIFIKALCMYKCECSFELYNFRYHMKNLLLVRASFLHSIIVYVLLYITLHMCIVVTLLASRWNRLLALYGQCWNRITSNSPAVWFSFF